ncbi:MAG TPA: alkaline phosphatase PhoX [Leptolyngbyaceae cyanobacterium]
MSCCQKGFSYELIAAWDNKVGDSRFGYNNDYLSFVANRKDSGYLTVNFEHISAHLWMQTYEQVKEQGYIDELGDRIIDTFANCPGKITVWGTVLSAEENFQNHVYKEDTEIAPGSLYSSFTPGAKSKEGGPNKRVFPRIKGKTPYEDGWVMHLTEEDRVGNNSIWYIPTSEANAGKAYLFGIGLMECDTRHSFTTDEQTILSIQHSPEGHGTRRDQAIETHKLTVTTTKGEKFQQIRSVPVGSNCLDKSNNAPPKPGVVAIERYYQSG